LGGDDQLAKLLMWTKSADDRKTREEKVLLRVDTTAASPKVEMDQSYEVDTDFGPVRYASGDQRYVEDGMVFFDKVTRIV